MLFRGIHTSVAALMLLSAFSLGGCGTTGGLPSLPSQSQIDSTVATVQEGVKNACGWLPTATTVAKIIATLAGAPGVIDVPATAIAGICTALQAKSARRGAGPARYRGVVIHARRA